MEFRFDRLMELAKQRGFETEGALAAAAGIERAILHRLRTGKQQSVSSETARRLSETVGCTQDYLWGLSDNPGVVWDPMNLELLTIMHDIGKLPPARRTEIRDIIAVFQRAERSDIEFRETLMGLLDRLLTPGESEVVATAIGLARGGDIAGATALVDRVIAERNAQQASQ